MKDELTRMRADLAQSHKKSSSAEMNLALLTTEHQKTVASLAKVQQAVSELKEQNEEMEELLRGKCVEIEENDDKFIQYVKITPSFRSAS